MKNIFTIAVFLFSGVSAYNQCNYLTAFDGDYDGTVSLAVKAGNKLFFSAFDNVHGRELWVTDGTSTGTHIVKDINPGTSNSVTINFGFSAHEFNDVLYFKANNGITGPELWRSDGTEEGTWLVKDLYADNGDHSISDFASTDSELYFISNGNTLWRSNGTTAGTLPVRSFMIARGLAAFKNNIYFSAAADNNGEELWKCNGTTGVAVLLKDLNGSIGTSLPCNFHATKNALYFMANTNAGWELWKTKGSFESTQMVKDINPGGADGVLDHYSDATIVNIDNTVYFKATDGVAGYQLWKSDGTESGTVKVSNIANGVSQYCNFPVVNGKILFNSYSDTYYWQYDPVLNIVSATGYPFHQYFEYNYNRNAGFIGTHLYYAGADSVYGSEMWLSGGSAATTRKIQETHLVDNFFTISTNAFNSILGTLGSKLLFTLARRPYDTKVPLFAYDTSLNSITDLAPSVIVPVPFPNNKMHLVWNRIENASQYQVRYRLNSGNTAWKIKESEFSFTQFADLNENANYAIQIRARCNNVWTPWSDKLTYNSSFTAHDYTVNILADRAEDATSTHIYWLKTPEITRIKLRYRIAGTVAWAALQNKTGLVKLTNLQPSSFYEYQYGSYINGNWGGWYPSSLYFVTPDESINVPVANVEDKKNKTELLISPNPATSLINIKSKISPNAYFIITDAGGNILKMGRLNNGTANLSGLHPGILAITVKDGNIQQSGKVLKE